MTPRLTFHGGAGTVTGSCFRVEHAQGSFLVDCGMFQGPKSVKELNYGSFPFDPPGVDFLLLTHAHIDHSGLVPKLCKRGFKGPIHATAPTVDLLAFMLPDSGHIQESEVERLNRRNRRRGKPEVTPSTPGPTPKPASRRRAGRRLAQRPRRASAAAAPDVGRAAG